MLCRLVEFLRGSKHRFQISDELVHIGLGGVPRAHEATAALPDEGVELPTLGAQSIDGGLGQLGKDGVGLAWEKDFDLRERTKF